MITLRYTLLVLAGVSFITVFMTDIVNGAALIGLIALAGAAATSATVRAWAGAFVADDPSADRTVFDVLDRPAPRHVAPDECDCAVDHGEAGYDADRTAS